MTTENIEPQETAPEPTQEASVQTETTVEPEQPVDEPDRDGKLKSERERDAIGFEERRKRQERDMAIKQAVIEQETKRLEQERLKQSQPQETIQPQYNHKVVGDPASYGYVYNPNMPPIRENFLNEDTYEIDEVAFAKASTEYNRNIISDTVKSTIAEEQKRTNQRQQHESMMQKIQRKEDEYMAQNPDSDYLTVVDNAAPLLKGLNPDVVDAIFEGENPCEVMYQVSSDPSILAKLKSSNPISVGMELSRLQASVKTAGRVVSNASEPPPNPKTSVSSTGKSKTQMSRSEYYAKRREELGVRR